MCRIATVRTTGTSPRRGSANCPRASSKASNASDAIADRIAEAHSGGTLSTINFVTGQFDPQVMTTTANSSNAARRDRKCFIADPATNLL
jgi:hypothetical protein